MKTQEMKTTLYNKLQDEKTNFKQQDIKVVKSCSDYMITIKGFEHIPFKLQFELDDFLGYVVYVQYFNGIYYETIEMFEDKHEYQTQTALLHLGYYITTRF